MSNRLNPDQAPQIVGPDLGPNCLQMAVVGDELTNQISLRFLQSFSLDWFVLPECNKSPEMKVTQRFLCRE